MRFHCTYLILSQSNLGKNNPLWTFHCLWVFDMLYWLCLCVCASKFPLPGTNMFLSWQPLWCLGEWGRQHPDSTRHRSWKQFQLSQKMGRYHKRSRQTAKSRQTTISVSQHRINSRLSSHNWNSVYCDFNKKNPPPCATCLSPVAFWWGNIHFTFFPPPGKIMPQSKRQVFSFQFSFTELECVQ